VFVNVARVQNQPAGCMSCRANLHTSHITYKPIGLANAGRPFCAGPLCEGQLTQGAGNVSRPQISGAQAVQTALSASEARHTSARSNVHGAPYFVKRQCHFFHVS
jgi:hypothetical protein